ncbi:hypothetical protein VN24_07135 [Paenibacillus beijingensis]|uniref:Putative amidase domain-containing protein n=1 Tax=Paenibacillus beijingensis TaxID=1126833 RepID=A0A0D5NQM2_9BACL|nr:hypothetical protein VN24_07135 [Paenibacillus beijingensis]
MNCFNQAEIDRRLTVFDGLLADDDHRWRMEERLKRLHSRELARGILAPQSEIKASLVRVHESSSEVSVLIALHIKRTVEHRGRIYTEERLEQERLWLVKENERWRIVRVEPTVGERRPKYGTEAASGALAEHRSFGGGREAARSESRPLPFLNHALLPRLNERERAVTYRRDLVAAYADQWWKLPNPSYEPFEVNCTNYVSQCIFAGSAPMNYTGKRESGWWYKGRSGGAELWSYSWAVSNALQVYLSFPRSRGFRAQSVDSAQELQLGDVIMYDWSGDGRYQHTTIVTAFDADGMPLVNANTVPSRHRYWDYRDSYAWTERTRYRFYHIADTF